MDNWKNRNKDKMLEARFEFSDYDKLRDFLDLLAEKADEVEHHPNVSFGKNYASVAIYAKNEILADVDFDLAKSINNAFETINKS
jgi:4a-hydroxytetrahydrobiopterin dehydratase